MTDTETRPLLIPTGDPTPVEKAVVSGIVDDFEPETYLHFLFRRPDGGGRLWDAWTVGGHQLGDDIDRRALAAGMDVADWLHISARHCTEHTRGRIHITAYPLRPVLADVQAEVRGPRDHWVRLRKVICEHIGQPDSADMHLPWLGFGPAFRAKLG